MLTPGVLVLRVEAIAVAAAPLLPRVTVAVLHSLGSMRLLPLVTALLLRVSTGSGEDTCRLNCAERCAPQVSVAVGRIL